MAEWSGLTPAFLTSGRNAKSDFPLDFEAYFRDDVAVCMQFDFPSVKKILGQASVFPGFGLRIYAVLRFKVSGLGLRI